MKTIGKKEGVASVSTNRPPPRLKVIEKGHVNPPIGGQSRPDDKKPLQCWKCGGNHHKIDCS